MNNTERLIGKMNDELAAFVAGLERLPVQDVIEKAGEIAVKTDMALLVEEAFLGPKETKALLGMRMPLEYLYQEYLKKCQRRFEIVRKRRRNFVAFGGGGNKNQVLPCLPCKIWRSEGRTLLAIVYL